MMDQAERWLRENDPKFNYADRRRLEHPFYTVERERDKLEDEIPVSNLWGLRKKIGLNDHEAINIIENLK